MCGIIAYTGKQQATPILLQGLKRLEYRGYDSSGISTVARGRIRTFKAAGKLAVLESQLPQRVTGKSGIGHTRWATHGRPSDENAHPHNDTGDIVSLIHNGIIENAESLRQDLIEKQTTLASETDSEVLVHLIAQTQRDTGSTLTESVRLVLRRVRGTYGLAVLNAEKPDRNNTKNTSHYLYRHHRL